jgi:hypothetical protein
MSSGWSYETGASNSTPLTEVYTIEVDVGTSNLTGLGYGLLAFSPDNEWYTTAVALP